MRKYNKIFSIILCGIMMASTFQNVYAKEPVYEKGTGLYDEIELLEANGLTTNRSTENETYVDETVTEENQDEKINQFQGKIENTDSSVYATEENEDFIASFDSYNGYYSENDVATSSLAKAGVSYYAGTSIPTYTSVTGRKLITSITDDGYTLCYYTYDLDEYFDYVYYLRDYCGWEVYKTTTSADSSYATIYLVKGGSMIAVIANFVYFQTVVMYEAPKNTTVSPTGVSLNTSSRSMIVGNSYTLEATVKPSNVTNTTVTWSSSDSSVASVSSKGVVTAKATGKATITAATSNGKKATCAITVKALVLEYYPNTNTPIPTFTCITGKSLYNKTVSDGLAMYQYKLDVESHTDYEAYLVKKAGWSIFDEQKASDNSYFLATYEKGDDVVLVMADFKNNMTVIGFEEFANVAVTGISLNKTSTTLGVGKSETLTATITPSNATNKNITWTSSNTNVATVSNGVVLAKSVGTAVITAKTSDGNKKATCNVTVKDNDIAVTGISLNKTSATLDVGKSETLTATITPGNATNKNITWTSSNTNVATVSNGVVTAKAEGTTIISASTSDGTITAECEVKVVKPVPKIRIVDVNGKAGKTVNVTFKLENNPGIAVLGFDIGYDSNAMSLQSVAVNDVFSNSDVTSCDIEKNPYTFTALNVNGNVTANGTLITATFLIKENCADGDYIITISDIESYDIDEKAVTFTGINGTISVKDSTPGDVTGDGNVNRQDLLRLGKYLAGWDVEIDSIAADVTNDGNVNRQDLLRLGKYLAGWDVELGK